MSGPDVHPDDPLLLASRELARAMDLFDDAACRSLGIGRSDLRALNLLEHGPLSPAALADALHLSRSSVTTLLDRLVRAGYVARTKDPDDRRGLQVVLEPETFRAFAAVYRPLGRRVHASVRHLDDEQREAVIAGIRAMATAFREARQSDVRTR